MRTIESGAGRDAVLKEGKMPGLLKSLLVISFFVFSAVCANAEGEITASPVEKCAEYSKPCVRDTPSGARVSERLFGLPGLTNTGRVAPGIYRGAQPAKEGYATLKKMGIKTVVNLRNGHGEKDDVEALGMKSVEIPFTTFSVDPEKVKKVLAILKDKSNLPVFIHCMEGKDRTGVVAAVYRMDVDGWSLKDADAEMLSYGFHHIWTKLREFVEDYGKARLRPVEEGKGNGEAAAEAAP